VWMSRPDLEDLRELPVVESAAGFLPTTGTITEGGSPDVLAAARVTGDLMATLGVVPRLGRDLGFDDTGPGSPGYVVIGHDLWMERFGGDEDVVGRTLELSERPWEIVGVMPPGFRAWLPAESPRSGVLALQEAGELWLGPDRDPREPCGSAMEALRISHGRDRDRGRPRAARRRCCG